VPPPISTVHHEVVGVRQHRSRIGFESVEMLVEGAGERMVVRAPPLLLVVPLEQREVDDPERMEALGGKPELSAEMHS
jgi:hypothetical protein